MRATRADLILSWITRLKEFLESFLVAEQACSFLILTAGFVSQTHLKDGIGQGCFLVHFDS